MKKLGLVCFNISIASVCMLFLYGCPKGDLQTRTDSLVVRCSEVSTCPTGTRCDSNGFCIAPKSIDGVGAPGDACYRTEHCLSRLCTCDDGKFAIQSSRNTCLTGAQGVVCVGKSGLSAMCFVDENCKSGRCREGVCVPVDGTGAAGQYCHHEEHCESKICRCPAGDKASGFCGTAQIPDTGRCDARQGWGGRCTRNENCLTDGQCVEGLCAPLNFTGGPGQYCHHDDHCATNLCLCPVGKRGGFCGTASAPEPGKCWRPGSPGVGGSFCRNNAHCESDFACVDGLRCAPHNDSGDPGDYCHHDDHCATGLSCQCPGGKNSGFCTNWEDGINLGTCG